MALGLSLEVLPKGQRERERDNMSSKNKKQKVLPDEGVNFALKKLKDGQKGRDGSLENVLKKVQKLEAIVKSQPSRRKTLKDLNMEELYREVMDRPETEIAAAIEQVMLAVAKSIMDGNGFAYQLPSRGQNDQVYIDQLDRIVLKNTSLSVGAKGRGTCRWPCPAGTQFP